MPNLTMQYMADTASIELIRNCAEEGLLKQSCKGKQVSVMKAPLETFKLFNTKYLLKYAFKKSQKNHKIQKSFKFHICI